MKKKKNVNRIDKSTIILLSCFATLCLLLVITVGIKSNSKVVLSEGSATTSTIFTSSKEYRPTSIANVFVEQTKEEKIEEVKEEEPKKEEVKQAETKKEETKQEEVTTPTRNEVYDGMTIEELSDKLNRSLNSTVAGYGNLFASYSLEKGVDPYLSVAIMLHETGCKWRCSNLVTSCNNVGGQKGSPSCGGGSYKRYDTLDDGIRGYIDNLANNYFALGLNTTESISAKYTGYSGGDWASKVNSYIESIKAN